MAITYSGVKIEANFSTRGTLIEGDGLTPLASNTWFEVYESAPTGSTLPDGTPTFVFKTPDTGTSITPIAGDKVYPLTLESICKTDSEVTVEEGTIDVTDDCENGYNAMIFDGFRDISGTINGFLKYDEETKIIVDPVQKIMERFFNNVTDDGAGNYTITPTENEKVILFLDLNNNAKLGEVKNTLIVPALITSLGTGAGLKEAQNRNISWVKAQGYVSLYQRTLTAGDVA